MAFDSSPQTSELLSNMDQEKNTLLTQRNTQRVQRRTAPHLFSEWLGSLKWSDMSTGRSPSSPEESVS
jgi:hypothetical protein